MLCMRMNCTACWSAPIFPTPASGDRSWLGGYCSTLFTAQLLLWLHSYTVFLITNNLALLLHDYMEH
jgi:hypothetical protein